MLPLGVATPADRAIQRRTLGTLVGSQMLGGVGVSSGIAVGSLLAEQILGSPDLAGLGGTFQVLGSALIAIPMARITSVRGRRPGLGFGYLLGIAGAILLTTAGIVRSFPLLLAGSILFGGATAANNQARYAAADLAEDRHRGRDLSIVVWATTIGAVLGPNLVGLAGRVAEALGIPALTGPFLFSLTGFGLAATLLAARPRPQAQAQEGGVATKERRPAPSGLRAKGIDDDAPPLTYSGPSEDGSAEVQRSGGNGGHGTPHRREQARAARSRASSRRRPSRQTGLAQFSTRAAMRASVARIRPRPGAASSPSSASDAAGPWTRPTSRGPACRRWSG